MVYESGYTTRRTYSSRPVVSSYSVSNPTSTMVSRVYKTSYPIYSTAYTRGTRVISSPVRVISLPSHVIAPSPVRIVRSTTTRVITSPVRYASYTCTTPITSSYTPSTYTSTFVPSYFPSISSGIPSLYLHAKPSLYCPPFNCGYTHSVSPIKVTAPVRLTPSYMKRSLPGYGTRALSNYLNTEPFTTFREETRRIRHRAQSLVRDLHTPIIRRARSCTPFPVTGPLSELALDAYVSRVTNPMRHIAQEVHRMSMYPEPARKYMGKSHLASIKICDNKAYYKRSPQIDSDKLRTDINLLSWYLRHPSENHTKQQMDNVDTDPELDPNRPSRKFSSTSLLEDHAEENSEMKEKQRLRQERLMTLNKEDIVNNEMEKNKVQHADEAPLYAEK